MALSRRRNGKGEFLTRLFAQRPNLLLFDIAKLGHRGPVGPEAIGRNHRRRAMAPQRFLHESHLPDRPLATGNAFLPAVGGYRQ